MKKGRSRKGAAFSLCRSAKRQAMYTLIYWSNIQGRGEFVRLLLEEIGVPYRDLGREEGDEKVAETLYQRGFGPPLLQDGDFLLAQTAAICDYLGRKHDLASAEPHYALQLQLTIADAVTEVHDTHHPIASSLYYEDQKEPARLRARNFTQERLPKFLPYFQKQLEDRHYLIQDQLSYPDLSLFQLLEGLRYAFPRAFDRHCPESLRQHRDRLASRPRIKQYLESERRIPFNQEGIFRHYPELDA